jgi:hypothetical protein
VLAGEIEGQIQHASATCLELVGQKKTLVHLCTPWDPYGGPSLTMAEETGAYIHIGLDAYTVTVLARTTPSKRGDRGTLLLGVSQDRASIQVSDKEGRRTQLRPDGMAAYDSQGAVRYQTPGSTPLGRTKD